MIFFKFCFRVEDDLCQARHCLNPNTVFSTQGFLFNLLKLTL